MVTTSHFQGPGFHMDVPTDWLITSSPQFQVVFIAPPEKYGRANLAINIRPVTKDATLEEIQQTAAKMQQRDYAKYQLESEGELPNTNGMGYQRTYTWFNERNNVHVYQKQLMFLVNEMLTTITITRELEPKSKEVDEIFNQMLASFAFD
jgi:hypothetical protein